MTVNDASERLRAAIAGRPLGGIGKRRVTIALSFASVALIGALLTATIYWTLADPRWIVFLGGVLFAAVIATAGRISTVEWTIVRRTQQLARMRAKHVEEARRTRAATDALRISEGRMRVLCDALPTPIFFVDRDTRCHFHNTAAAAIVRCPRNAVDQHLLSDAVGADAFAVIEPHLGRALAGRGASHALPWPGLPGAEGFAVRQVPFPPDDPTPTGVYLIFRADEGLSGAAEADEPRAKLEQALKNNEFLLLAQPIVALRPSQPAQACYEILLRQKEEEDNLLPPGGFFPVAERCGMMEALDRWVVSDVATYCVEARAGRGDEDHDLFCVNLSATAVRSRAFGPFVQELLLERPFVGRSLCFEIAEHEIAHARADVVRLIDMLKPLGCRFSADGLGADEPCDLLRGLAFDFVKIDSALIQSMARDAVEMGKVRAIATLCRKSGIRTIAQFVEDQATLETLRGIGVDYAQGFGVARPERLRSTPRPATPARRAMAAVA